MRVRSLPSGVVTCSRQYVIAGRSKTRLQIVTNKKSVEPLVYLPETLECPM